MTANATNLVILLLEFFGRVPDAVKDRLDPAHDSLIGYRFDPIEGVRFRHRLDAGGDYQVGYWDQGIAMLVHRLGGPDAIREIAKEALPHRREFMLVREARSPDIVDGPGAFSYDSEYATIPLSAETVSQIGELGLAIRLQYRIMPPAPPEKTGS